MSDVNAPCLGCAVVSGATRPVGGVLARVSGLVVHGVAAPSPLPGWVVISSEQHVRAWYELEGEPARELGPLAARVMRAQREVLGAEHAYAFAIGDVLRHFHLHLVPRFADTPQRLRGRGAFDFTQADALSAEALEAAAQALAAALRA
ncbi:HIT family protein [Stigmatella erecta]|uniref:Diadenosine tetraphosphate (Ap4A) hydrolase n=1 Tax=Stigmatella erecta TaxID=83460 RepID=A0A1I0KR00_9BACT|nr:HIT family protein [Stigmatella erecta]SEU27848.1 Diadenosine tetraphosphate (Ap4A) hydrolase [Stigmatella erecta]